MEEELKQFAQKIKEKYPDYADLDDIDLAERVIRKHPVYASQIKLPSDFKLLQTSSGYPKIDDLYEQIGREENVDPNLLLEQGRKETRFKPENFYGINQSPKGAIGAGQFMKGTAPTYGLTVNENQDDRKDPVKSIRAQAKYMRKLLDQFDNNESLALAGYNSGEYRQSLRNGQIPNIAETQDYVKTISENLKKAREAKGKSLRDYLGSQVVPQLPQTDQNSQLDKYQDFVKGLPKTQLPPSFEDWSSGQIASVASIPVNPQQAKTPAIIVNQDDKPIISNPAQQSVQNPVPTINNNVQFDKPTAPTMQEQPNPGYQEYLRVLQEQGLPSDDSSENRSAFAQIEQGSQRAAIKQNKSDLAQYKKEASLHQPASTQQPLVNQVQVTQPQPSPAPQTRMGVLKDEDFGKSLAGTVNVDLKQKPKGMALDEYLFRSGLQGVAAKYGLSNADIDRAVSVYRAKGDLIQGKPELSQINDKELPEYLKTHGNPNFQVTREQVAAALGSDEKPLADFKQEQQDNLLKIAGQKDPLSFKDSDQASLQRSFRTDENRQELLDPFRAQAIRNLSGQGFGLLKDTLTPFGTLPLPDPLGGTDEEAIQKEAELLRQAALTDVDKEEAYRLGEEMGKSGRGSFKAALLEHAAGSVDFFNGLIGRNLRGVGIEALNIRAMNAAENLRSQADAAYRSADNSGKAIQFLTQIPLDLGRIAALSLLPGGEVAAFALDAGLKAKGRGGNLLNVAGETLKGAALGKLFGASGKIEEALTSAGVNKLLASGTKIGVVAGGTGGIELASGATPEQALHSVLLNTLFDVVGKVGGLGKDRIYRIWADKSPHDLYLSKDNEVFEVPKQKDGLITAEVVAKSGFKENAASTLERKGQVNELDKLGFSSKEIDSINSKDAKEIIENQHTPADWEQIQKAETETPKLGLEDKLNGKKELPKSPSSVDEKNVLPENETALPEKVETKAELPPVGETQKETVPAEETSEPLPAKTVTVNGKKVGLTPEQAGRWAKEVEEPLKKINEDYKNDLRRAAEARQSGQKGVAASIEEMANKIKKAKSFQISAVKREITGLQTATEKAKIQQRESSNYIGKEVEVDGKKGSVVGGSFVKVKVEFEDGSKASFPAEKVKGREKQPVQAETSNVQPVVEKPVNTEKTDVQEKQIEEKSPVKTAEDNSASVKTENPVAEKQTPTPAESTTAKSKVGKSIETEAIEKKLTEGFEGTAEFERIDLKDEAKKASELINNDLEKVKRIINGEEKAPKDLHPTSLLIAAEAHAQKTGDVQMLRDLANSDLVKETSTAAQSLRILREREANSPLALIEDIQNVREKTALRRLGKKDVKTAVKEEIDKITTELRKTTPKKNEFHDFIRQITCK